MKTTEARVTARTGYMTTLKSEEIGTTFIVNRKLVDVLQHEDAPSLRVGQSVELGWLRGDWRMIRAFWRCARCRKEVPPERGLAVGDLCDACDHLDGDVD